mgnify:CR=1 FL=1
MQITDVRVAQGEQRGKIKAVVSITIDNEFVVHDIEGDRREKACYRNAETKKLWMGNIAISHIRSIRYKRKDSEYDIGSVSGISGSRYGRIWGNVRRGK